MSASLLRVTNLTVGYDQVEVIHGISLKVSTGQLVTVIGANGAGKTTLVNALMGITPGRGEVIFNGAALVVAPIEARVARGLSLVPERRELFGDMTVEDNLLLGGFRRSRSQRQDSLQQILSVFPRLNERIHQLAGTLSGGERQMLALGRALMGNPKLLMLDEPSLGLAPRIVRDVFDILLKLKKTEISILLIEQNARAALQIADYAYVMELGVIVKEGQPAEVGNDERLVESYLGLGTNKY